MTRLVSVALLIHGLACHVCASEFSLDISIRSAKQLFLVAEPVVFHVCVENKGREPLYDHWFLLDSRLSFRFKHAVNSNAVDNLCLEAPYGVPFRTCLERTLKPGESLETTIEVLEGDPIIPSTYFLGQALDRGEYGRGGGILRSLVAGSFRAHFQYVVKNLLLDKSDKLALDLRKVEEEKDYATAETVFKRRDLHYLCAETNVLFQIREPEGPEKKAFEDYTNVWVAVMNKDLKTGEQALSALGSHSSDSTYYEWGLYYVGRLALEKNALETSQRLFSELRKRDKFPLSIEVDYWLLLTRKRQGKLSKDDPDLLALKEKTKNRLLLPQLVWKEKITRVQSLEKD